MIKALLDVLKDLWIFIFPIKTRPRLANKTVFLLEDTKTITALSGQTAYLLKDTDLLIRPEVSFDSKIDTCHYGKKVMAFGTEGEFVNVATQGNSGWIKANDLTFNIQDIIPQLESGTVYDYNKPETKKIRNYIQDEFFGEKLVLPLQSAEYVFYRVKSSGINFHWPPKRPRLAGFWHGILKGNPKVYLTINPKTSSVMEGQDKESYFLAYVEAVHPDQSIIISSIGRKSDGEYLKERVEIEQWREWRPVFIAFK